jgi:hypothetical protein
MPPRSLVASTFSRTRARQLGPDQGSRLASGSQKEEENKLRRGSAALQPATERNIDVNAAENTVERLVGRSSNS